MSSASRIAPTFSDTSPQSAWVTPSGLSMAMRTNRALPPPLTSTSTSSRPSDRVTCCAISSIFAATTSRIVTGIAAPKKKVGFRPLTWLDNSNHSVACLFGLRKGAECGYGTNGAGRHTSDELPAADLKGKCGEAWRYGKVAPGRSIQYESSSTCGTSRSGDREILLVSTQDVL